MFGVRTKNTLSQAVGEIKQESNICKDQVDEVFIDISSPATTAGRDGAPSTAAGQREGDGGAPATDGGDTGRGRRRGRRG